MASESSGQQPIVRVHDGYRYEDGIAHIGRLLERYSSLRRVEIGKSVLGKSIDAIVIGKGAECVHANASVHANEWITTPLLLRFIEQLAALYESVPGIEDHRHNSQVMKSLSDVLSDVTLWAVPMVNPDGMNLSQDGLWPGCPFRVQLMEWNSGQEDFSRWKANIRGVDLNDQFPAGWEEERLRRGVAAPASQDYGGEHPLCEPEAFALAALTRRISFSRVASLHTQGREIYWNYRNLEPAYSEGLARRLAKVSGYEAVKLMDSDAGYKDWFISEFRRPGFTIEAGEGVNPLPPEQFEQIYSEISLLLAAFIRG
ncbi:M14 family metallopeptidase [Paenibacillus lentus]|uniref:Peptidase M14 n=1 Tax=Paenibacillus lentus TaxID=1338368 RepID=A0A3Q8SDB5_9BACL|nr:M14 family metallocarboxypeptidase [Paenibacillus lentus]AZK48037.1 peptidase M14 [Paenibacillus lentus]